MIVHYYKRSIGDYHRKAGRLNILQHGVYNLLIDACYDREKFPTREEAIDWIWAESDEEIAAVDYVLKKFFQQDDEGRFIQNHIREDLEKYHNRSITQTENGKKGGRPKKAVGNNSEPDDNLDETQNNPMGFDGKPNETQDKPSLVKPLTTNHKPINQEPLKNSLSQKEGEVDDDENWNQPDPPILVDGWQPEFIEIQKNLRELGLKPCDQSKLDRVLVKFKKSRRGQYEDEGVLELALCNWINNEREPAQPRGKPPANQQAEPQRTTDTTKLRERKFEDYHDSQVYSGTFTAGQIRENLQDGETPDECVLRLTKAMLGKAGV